MKVAKGNVLFEVCTIPDLIDVPLSFMLRCPSFLQKLIKFLGLDTFLVVDRNLSRK